MPPRKRSRAPVDGSPITFEFGDGYRFRVAREEWNTAKRADGGRYVRGTVLTPDGERYQASKTVEQLLRAPLEWRLNPKRRGESLGDTIRRLRLEGFPQKQAVAIAHREHGIARPKRTARRRKNPELVTYFANPRGPRVTIASDVQAVLYRHAQDGEYYLHVFGNQGDGEIVRRGGREYLRIDNLPTRTGVVLQQIGAQLLVKHKSGAPLAREFSE